MLRLEGLKLQLGDFELSADFSVKSGAVVAVMGPSGGGKSTLIAAIAGFVRPVAGRIWWDGTDLTMLPPGQRPVSVLFQDNNLFPHLTVHQNLALGIRPSGRITPQELRQVADVLTRVGLAGLGDRNPGALSGGQQSRAALARVLLGGRPLVLLDEPFAALGPGLKDEMLDLAATMLAAQGRMLIMATHDPADARRIANEVITVAAGAAKAPVSMVSFFADPPPGMRNYLGLDRS
jgi:thiamine transport system ATP-binding protein